MFRLMNWTLFELTPAKVTTARLSVRSTAIPLGAEDAPKEINGVADVHDWGGRGIEPGGQYIFGGFVGAGGGTGCKFSLVPLTSVGGLGFEEFAPP